MQNSINERLRTLINYYNVSISEFSRQLGYNSAEKISRILRDDSNKNKPGFDILHDISNKFDEINTEWLLTGKGEMLKSEKTGISDLVLGNEVVGNGNNLSINKNSNNNEDKSLTKEIEYLKEQNQLLKEMIELLKKK